MERRQFLATSAAAVLAASPNSRVRVACVGLRARGLDHLNGYAKIPGVEIAALCDIDESVMAARLKDTQQLGFKPKVYMDFRKLLEDKSIDAVSIATPDHHHTLQTIWACQAGKDVYVEKPVAHDIFECRQIAAAVKKYGRVVQTGTQARSSEAVKEAIRHLHTGLIGDPYMVRALCFKWRESIGRTKPEAVPKGVNYDAWMGPAPVKPFTRNRFHYNWHWQWDYGSGDIGNQAPHQLDIGRWGLGVTYPTKVSAVGGHFMFDDDQETPNVLVATFEFNKGGKKKLMVAEVRHWITNHEAGVGGTNAGGNTIGNIFYGPNGLLTLDGNTWADAGEGYRSFIGKELKDGPSRTQPNNHFHNFIDAVRSHKPEMLNAPVEEGAITAALVNLANISYRLGRTIRFDEATFTCPGDKEATAMFGPRAYRAPYVVPKLA
ncbi:MAG TPA: Gfo/Idh/MocA family oxidoreductase [Bryobacteraceae bacterium]|nr:Gfo/Idh/MocA family oxidoreductase [Bryobacteraceae bacterium]